MLLLARSDALKAAARLVPGGGTGKPNPCLIAMIGLMISPMARGITAPEESTPVPTGVGTPTRKAYSSFQVLIQLASKITSPSIISPVIGSLRRPDMAKVEPVVIQRKVQ